LVIGHWAVVIGSLGCGHWVIGLWLFPGLVAPDSLVPDWLPSRFRQRNTADYLQQLHQSGAPVVLRVNGVAEVVVQDAAAYQRLLERAARADMAETVTGSATACGTGVSNSS
jgi:hypothetical protein